MRIFIVLLLALALPAPGLADKPTSKLAQVDWANRDYGRHMRLTNGRYTMRRYPHRSNPVAKRCRHTTQSTRLIKVHHADVRGDGAREALVELSAYSDMCNGGSDKRRVLIAFEWRAGAPHEIGRFSPSGVSDVRVENRRIYIRRVEARKTGWFSCRDVWRHRGGAFQLARSKCAAK